MKELGTQTIETERLILRKFRIEDAQAMYDNWACDPRTSRYVPWGVHENVEVTKEILNEWINSYAVPFTFNWVVELKTDSIIIGSITGVKVDKENKICEIGYCYGPNFWEKGYGTEALKGVINYLFNEVGFRLLEAKHLASNPASGRIMEKAGMQKDGILRERIIDKMTKEPTDIVYYSITKVEI